MTEEDREEQFARIQKLSNENQLAFKVDSLHPVYLSNEMINPKGLNLNQISYKSAMGLIRSFIDEGYHIKKCFVDTVGRPGTYQDMLSKKFHGEGITFVVEAKADAKFPIVSAASICAKVTRDH